MTYGAPTGFILLINIIWIIGWAVLTLLGRSLDWAPETRHRLGRLGALAVAAAGVVFVIVGIVDSRPISIVGGVLVAAMAGVLLKAPELIAAQRPRPGA
jgi:hypothetical protein